jgi:phosphatidylglycerol:prolipoprotein diacylglycerol transferase
MRPILFHLPIVGLPVYAYGTMLYLSFVVGWMLSLSLAERDGISRRASKICFVVTALAALIGARLLFVVTNPGAIHTIADVFDVSAGGLVAYGGFLGGLFGAMLFCRLSRVPFLVWADSAVPSLCTGLTLTRVGCLLAGCDYGVPWDGPWALRFPRGSPAFEQHAATGLIPGSAQSSLPVHPTQVYESLAGVCLLILVVYVRRRRGRGRSTPGEALAAFGAGYAVLRFAIEMVRGDVQRGAIGGLSTSQLIALLTCAAALVLMTALHRAARDRSRFNGSLSRGSL